eukprot:6194518-Pleurochrysis_carterae.AAC.1
MRQPPRAPPRVHAFSTTWGQLRCYSPTSPPSSHQPLSKLFFLCVGCLGLEAPVYALNDLKCVIQEMNTVARILAI